jgi:hypothetical protein
VPAKRLLNPIPGAGASASSLELRARKRFPVPRLAIVISAVGSIELLEGTLVSVLENRPADCEILVALDRTYADPYELKDEVRFVEAPHRSSPIACINAALAASRAPIVHLLASGCTVTEGWVEPAFARFGDRRVASVAPLVMDALGQDRIFAAGLGYRPSGRRVLVGRGQTQLLPRAATSMVGACGFAAFYRTAALELVGGLSVQLGPAQADVDLALALARAGFTAVIEPQSRVIAGAHLDAGEGSFRRALYEERLFWRNLPTTRRWTALAAHVGLVAWELTRSFLRPQVVSQLAGRAWACCQMGSYARRHAVLKQLANRASLEKSAREPIRVDPAHRAPPLADPVSVRAPSR